MAGKFINPEGIATIDNRKPRKAKLIGASDCLFKSRTGIAYPAPHQNYACWNFISELGDEAIVTTEDLEFLDLDSNSSVCPSRQPGLHPGAISITDDIDEPLPDDIWNFDA